jgi:hypothetical protein
MFKLSALRNICARLEAYFEGKKGMKEDVMIRKHKERTKHGKKGKNVNFNICV